jgi:hypothetical protein
MQIKESHIDDTCNSFEIVEKLKDIFTCDCDDIDNDVKHFSIKECDDYIFNVTFQTQLSDEKGAQFYMMMINQMLYNNGFTLKSFHTQEVNTPLLLSLFFSNKPENNCVEAYPNSFLSPQNIQINLN